MSKHDFITKSNYILFLESPRKFWDRFHSPESLPPENEFERALMEQGMAVDRIARKRFPSGFDCQPEGASFSDCLALTASAMQEADDSKSPRALLQPSFLHDGLFARVDILRPDEFGGYELLEVKAVSAPDKTHYQDVAFQLHVLRKKGMSISAAKIVHLNPEYVRHGELDLESLFIEADVTDKAQELQPDVISNIALARDVLAQEEPPPVDLDGAAVLNITKPELEHYAPELMTPDSVFRLPGIHRDKALILAREIREKKVAEGSDDLTVRVSELPDDARNLKQTVFRQCTVNKQMYCDRSVLREMFDRIEFPVTFLDFETILHAIPQFDGAKPNLQIPFQVCAFRAESPDEPIKLFEHLADHTVADPRQGVIACVNESMDGAGTVIAFNASFEIMCMEGMRELAQELNMPNLVDDIKAKMVDIGKPYMGYHVYSHEQKGSGGLKSVSSAFFLEDPYKGKSVKGGAQASYLFAQMAMGNIPPEQIPDIRAGLLAYCTQDVYGMVDLAAVSEVLADIPEDKRRFGKFLKAALKPLPEIVHELDSPVLEGRSKSPAKNKASKQIAY